jgi:AcrR family transcriptional regulator
MGDTRTSAGRRERKLAETRLGLVAALRDRLAADRTLEDIGVRELCDEVDISEQTFFNHFPSKVDLAIYFVQLWSIEAGWHAAQARSRGARAAVEAILDVTARDVERHPRVMAEVIAVQARMASKAPLREVSAVERALAFPDLPGIERVEARGLDGVLPPLIDLAVERGELPPDVDRQAAFLALTNVFFGVPLILGPRAPRAVRAAYHQQLAIVWAGLSGR